MSLDRVADLLRARIGLDPTAAGPGLFARALRRRQEHVGLAGDLDAYVRRLGSDADEFQELVEEVVTPETWFFRDEQPFRLFADRARAALAAGPAGRAYRVLSVPCASGEEPYSVAMALLDAGVDPSCVHIDAVDLSRSALARARRAIYSANAFRSADLGFRDRHFRHTAEGYALDPLVARLVRFHHGNIVAPVLLSGGAPFDAIFCRNLLIYLDPDARARALAGLDRLLDRTGVLLVGHAEHLGGLGESFRPVGPRGSFAYERAGDAVAPPVTRSEPAPTRPARAAKRPHPRPRKPATAPAPPRAAPAPSAPEPPREARLQEAARLAGLGRHEEALRLCEQDLHARGPTPAAYFLLGMTHQAAGDLARAEADLGKAVYLDPRHEEALLALALLAQRRGDRAAAEQFRRRAGRAFQENQGR